MKSYSIAEGHELVTQSYFYGVNLVPKFTDSSWSINKAYEINDYEIKSKDNLYGVVFISVEPHTDYTITFNTDSARYTIFADNKKETLSIEPTQGAKVDTFNSGKHKEIELNISTWSRLRDEDKRVWNLKLEKGTVATPWIPKWEDLKTVEEKLEHLHKLYHRRY